MEIYNLKVLLTVLLVYSPKTKAQNIQSQLRYKREGGLLSGLTQFGGDFSIPSISSGLETIADGVRGILSKTKDTVEKFTQPVSFGFNAQIGQTQDHNRPEYGSDNTNLNNAQIRQSADYRDTRPKYDTGRPNMNNAQFDHFNANGNIRAEYNNHDNFNQNNGNSRVTSDGYPNYETPNQNRDDEFNGPRIHANNARKNEQHNQRVDDGVITYTDNNFPVILLKENEIRR